MYERILAAVWLAAAGASAACGQGTQTATGALTAADSQQAHQVVQSFLDRYAEAQSARDIPKWWRVLGKDASLFLAPPLIAALRDDSIAREAPGEGTREVIDFDPFQLSQEACGQYEVAKVLQREGQFRISARGTCGRRVGTTQFQAGRVDGAWRITDVDYGSKTLKAYICEYAKADRLPSRRPARCW
jgi:hypothetical protein